MSLNMVTVLCPHMSSFLVCQQADVAELFLVKRRDNGRKHFIDTVSITQLFSLTPLVCAAEQVSRLPSQFVPSFALHFLGVLILRIPPFSS